MAVKIKCPHCEDMTFNRWDEYAEHILNAHEDDEMRANWASHALEDAETGVAAETPKIRGKPANRIPPSGG